MKIKTSELIGPALDWAVANALGYHWSLNGYFVWHELGHCTKYTKECPPYSTDWAQGGPIIDREIRKAGLDIWSRCSPVPDGLCAATYTRGVPDCYIYGPTPLIAAMRCFCASRLGDEVDIPDELA